ncbi:very short patch repair endonuclease [Pseudomonas sp. SJZ080]|uniref:very short patch repair endonuclease n=1 Tax=Pseudomonas sp. SJZ080 TaxID=2572888 RepID=UPI0011A1A097|nr:very short patch repair endonuclease [Pseudomonas sp. SJZ080]
MSRSIPSAITKSAGAQNISGASPRHRRGLRYRLHRKDLPGKPDLVFPKHWICKFVQDCFWRRHLSCKHACLPKSRPKFWLPKLAKYVETDLHTQQALETLG